MDPERRRRIYGTTAINGRTQYGKKSSVKHPKDHPWTYLTKINQDLRLHGCSGLGISYNYQRSKKIQKVSSLPSIGGTPRICHASGLSADAKTCRANCHIWAFSKALMAAEWQTTSRTISRSGISWHQENHWFNPKNAGGDGDGDDAAGGQGIVIPSQFLHIIAMSCS